jgi:hypothetical protein
MSPGSLNKFVGIMLFYVFISYILGPIVFYYLLDKTLIAAGHGFALGSIISVILWYTAGSKMV